MDNIPYRGHLVSVLWDKSDDQDGKGQGLHLLVDGKIVRSSKKLERLLVDGAVPGVVVQDRQDKVTTNSRSTTMAPIFPG